MAERSKIPPAGDPSALPFDWPVWYPLVHGPTHFRGFAAQTPAGADLGDLEPGECWVVGDEHPGVRRDWWKRRLRRPGDSRLELETFSALGNTGGGFVLVRNGDRRLFRSALAMLPAGRARWRTVRALLSKASHAGLTHLPGAAQVGTLRLRSSGLDRPVHPALAGPICAVARGVPGLHQKLILSLGETREAAPRIAKVSLGASSEPQIEREARALESLAALGEPRLAPGLLASGSHAGSRFLVQERLLGTRSPDELAPSHVDFLRALASATEAAVPFEELEGFAADAAYVRRRLARRGGAWTQAFVGLVEALEGSLSQTKVPCARTHGDFTPWNLVVSPEGGLRAFDWEYSNPSAPRAHDLFHFLTQVGVLVRRAPVDEVLATAEQASRGLARPLVLGDTASPASGKAPWALFGLYVLNAAVQAERRNELERPNFPQVEWLERAHVGLAEALADRIQVARRDAAEAAA